MGIDLLHLRKLLQLLYASEKQLIALIKADVRLEIACRDEVYGGGGDFYAPFWADVKDHVFNVKDLHQSTSERIEKNGGRDRLYPVLRDGFLKWWDTERRWTNAPFEQVRAPTAVRKINDILTVKVDNILAVKDSVGVARYVYPYFSEHPMLRDEAGRIGLRMLNITFPALNFANFRILDVPRGRIFAPDRYFLQGDEDVILQKKFFAIWNMYVEIEQRY